MKSKANKTNKPHISVCVPTYEMQGKGADLLKRGLESFCQQSFKNFEVVIADNSDDNVIYKLCQKYTPFLQINYFKNRRKGMAPNTNESIKGAKGDLIKILYMDDYFRSESSLQKIHDNFSSLDSWLVTGCEHTSDGKAFFKPHYPEFSEKIFAGENTIGSPSVLTIRNKNPLLFDENMTWLLDCDYYCRLYQKYGKPRVLRDINIVIGTGNHQMTNILSDERKQKEVDYMRKKYQLSK